MTMNPNDYDPNELRNVGKDPDDAFLDASGGSGAGGFGAMGADEVLQSKQYRELFLLERATATDGLGKPYLATLPESYAAELVVFEWLEFLVDRAGFRRTIDVLRFYRSIEWLTEGTESDLREYLQSFDDEGTDEGLGRSDHLLSLVYIARLAAMD